MTKRDYYEILEVSRQSSSEEIKRSFRLKARNLHPDNKNSGDEAAFKELAEAYEVLSDDQKRALYDRYGHEGVKGSTHSFDNFDFSSFAGFGIDELIESFFGGGFRTSRRSGPEPGSHLQYELQIDFLEAVFGVEKKISIKRLQECEECKGSGAEPESKTITCSTCTGTGQVQQVINSWFGQSIRVSECPSCQGSGKHIEKPCRGCHGIGLLKKNSDFTVKVPAGIDSGTRIRVPSGGDKGRHGGGFGDLFIFVMVKEHEEFIRDGENIFIKQNISFALAALGGEINIATVDGDKLLKVPAGTQSGTVIVLKSLGVPRLNNPSRRGDQLVQLNVETPIKLSKEERNLFEQLAQIRGERLGLDKEEKSDQKEIPKKVSGKEKTKTDPQINKMDNSIIDKIVEAFKSKADSV